MSALSLWASRAVTPQGVREGVRIVARDGRIAEVVDADTPRSGDEVFEGSMLLPGLVDLQVNGAEGVAYDAADPAERARATRYHLRRGTTSLLATLISAPLEQLAAAAERLAAEVDAAGPVVGLHLEGPFLAPEKAGAHAAASLVDPSREAVERLLGAARGGLRMLTLAPERPGACEAIQRLVRDGVVVAAGHSLASTAELERAIGAGLSFVTHVGNASDWPSRPYDPGPGYRRSEPGVVGTFLFESRLRGSLILDGLHLDTRLARALVELRGPENVALVSDATPATGLAPGSYRFGGLEVRIHESGYATSGQGLAGSVITLVDALRTAVEVAQIPLPAAVTMATQTPARVIGLGQRKGQLRPGCDADLLLVDPDWSVRAVYGLGERSPQ